MDTVPRVSSYQTPRRREVPLPPRWVTPPRVIEKTPLAQFVILSMLLHIMFILMFGAPTGGSRDGRAMWGAFQVALQGPVREPGPTPPVEQKVVAPAPKAKPERRPRADGGPITPIEPTVAKEIERTAVPEVRQEPFAFPPLLDRIVTPERKLEMAPPLQLPKPSEAPPAPPPLDVPTQPPAVPTPPVEVAAPVPIAPAPPPAVETPALPSVTPTPPVERPPIEVPALPAPRIETIAPPRIEPTPKPVETAPAQEIPVSPKPPPTIERIEPRVPPAVREPVEAPARIESPAPAKVEPALAPSPFRTPAPSTDAKPYDPTAPGIDLDAVRSRAGEIAREGIGRRGLLAFPMPALPERKTKMETAIENARKPDCRTVYQNLGLAAIMPLIANEFGEGKCRW